MRAFYIAALFTTIVAAVYCYPATTDEKNPETTEVVIVPLEARKPGSLPGLGADPEFGDQPIVDTGFFNSGSFSPISGFLQAMMARMRQQMSELLNRVPAKSSDLEGAGSLPDFFPRIGGIDLGKGNTTSVTKVVDGHKITINETEYKQGGDNSASFFKIRIIDVKPESSEVESNTEDDEIIVKPAKGEREELEDEKDNEIPKSKEIEVGGRILKKPEKLQAA